MKLIRPRTGVITRLNIISSLLLLALFVTLALSSYRREQALILKSAVNNARTISRQIIETRDYLSRQITREPQQSGALIPQVAASQIAGQLTKGSEFYVRQVSLRYRNPDNRPDSFEAETLKEASHGASREVWKVADGAPPGRTGEGKTLRYLITMTAEESCLTCHGSYESAPDFVRKRFPKGHFSYGYRVGEVIGAVSVAVPMQALYRDIGANLKTGLYYEGAVLLIFIALTAWIIRRTILLPVKAVSSGITDVARTGDFSRRLTAQSDDEVGELVSSFNELMAELERKTIQRRESEERYRNFIEIAQSPIVTFMADGKIVISNQKAERLFGMEKKELLGLSIFDFIEDRERLHQAIDDYFSAGSSDLIGTTTRQKVRDVCGKMVPVDMVISVSQSEQTPMFSAILRTIPR